MQNLKTMRIWVLWRYIEVKGRKTKKPVAAGGQPTGTNTEYQGTWVTYNEAVRAKERLKADGIGFVIPEGYFFLDIDHRDLNDSFVQMMLSRFHSYAEVSPSGNGLHIYGSADMTKLPISLNKDGKHKLDRQFYMKNPNNGTELYIGGLTNRFATFTGSAVQDLPLAECTEAVLTTLDKDMRRSQPKSYSAKRDGDRETFDIICNLRRQKNGAKFRRLFDNGDISGYGSRSEADLALCTLIAFRTGDDPSMIDTLFQQSAPMRDKWNRADYREATIRKAIEACGGKFHKSVMSHPDWIVFNEKGVPHIQPAILAKEVKQQIHNIFLSGTTARKACGFMSMSMVYMYFMHRICSGQ